MKRANDTIAGYKVEALLAEGAFSSLFVAEQLSLRRRVALKVLPAMDEAVRDRSLREGALLASLQHPNVVPVYDAGEADGVAFVSMAFIDGGSLADRLRIGTLAPNQTLDVMTGVAAALDAAAQAGLVHRDVKPSNILVDRSGHPYLADFGATVVVEEGTQRFVGTPAYAAPEQLRGGALTPATDIYALTCVMYECLAGSPPYPRATRPEVELAHLTEPPPRLRDETGSRLNPVIAQGMTKDPLARFETATMLVDAARSAVADLPEALLRLPAPATPATTLPCASATTTTCNDA